MEYVYILVNNCVLSQSTYLSIPKNNEDSATSGPRILVQYICYSHLFYSTIDAIITHCKKGETEKTANKYV